MRTFVKLGGSLITDKKAQKAFRQETAVRLAKEIQLALEHQPNLELLLGHGSGSFGHFEANKHNTIDGVHTGDQWQGFAQVASVAAELNALVAQTLQSAGIPIFRIQPSASARAQDGKLIHMNIENIQRILEHGLVPLIYGDVAFDTIRNGTIISTETIFTYLVGKLYPERIILVGEVDGVYNQAGDVIPEISPRQF